jgi:hypothetical protein
MKAVVHREFLITRYILFLQQRRLGPIYSSLIFGASFNLPAFVFSFYQKIPLSFGYLSCLSWLFIGPFLIYNAGKIANELWPQLTELLEKCEIKELQTYEKSFESFRYLIIGIPAAVGVSILVLAPQGVLTSSISLYTIFYLVSWIVLALLGSIGIWGTFQLVLMIWKVRKYELSLDPYSPDGFGGMGVLANFAIKATLMYSTGALMIPMVYDVATRQDTLNQTFSGAIFGSTFFSFTVLLSFLVPLVALNRAAVKGRESLLKKTAKQCNEFLEVCKQNSEIESGIQMLVAQSHYNQISQMRVYPFDVGILLKLTASVALPIFLGTLRIWLPWLPLLQ